MSTENKNINPEKLETQSDPNDSAAIVNNNKNDTQNETVVKPYVKPSRALSEDDMILEELENGKYKLPNGIIVDCYPTVGKYNQLINLRTLDTRTAEEKREISINGGNTSHTKRRQRKTAQDSIRLLLAMQATEKDREKFSLDHEKEIDEIPEGITQLDLVNLSMLERAKAGSDKAATYVRDTAGDKPTEKQEITADIMTDADREMIQNALKRNAAAGPEE